MEHRMGAIPDTASVIATRGCAALLLLSLLAMVACGGSGGKKNNNPVGNRAPVANAGADQNVNELTLVQLNGSGSDADNDTLSYSWMQTAGPAVTLSGADLAAASFTAPDVAAGAPETLTFRLSVSDGTATATDAVNITVAEPSPAVTVTGKVNYESVPPNTNCAGLNFAATVVRPIRGATVQLINAGSGTILATTVSDDAGDYSFANINAGTMVRLRVRAELKKTTGLSRWNVEVRDNYDASPSPPALAARPLYVVEGVNFDTGTAPIKVQNMTATTGWGGGSYTGPRAAAPFAILDAIYTAVRFVEAVDSGINFAPLDVFWSIHNTATVSGNPNLGELGTSFYSPSIDSLFLIGDASSDTEEFDDHVIVHEWGHYFEDTLSRSDSIGGPHSIGEFLDPRIAFGEGWATALAGMALNNHLYCDTGVPGTSGGFGIGAESGAYNASGWYDEISVVRFIYDLFDDNNENGADPIALGFQPIYAVMTGPQAFTDAFTTVFSFATELRAMLAPADQALLDAQLAREDMTAAGLDIWGSGELNDASSGTDVLPVYTDYTADGSVLPICVTSRFDSGRDGNKLSENRLLRISVPLTDQYDVTISTTTPTPVTADPNDRDQSDPDIYIYQGPNYITEGTSPVSNSETFRTPTLQSGLTYIAAIEDWRFDDDAAPPGYPQQICLDVSFASTP
jgi:K319L-like, PKD domain